MNNVRIIATGSYLPERELSNEELSQIVDTTDEWIKSRTGISSRRISCGENGSTLGAKAAEAALKNCKISPKDLELIIVATSSPDSFTPSNACRIQNALGASKAVAFDISAACSGFLFALDTARRFIISGGYSNALVIGTEVLSRLVNWEDRSTCVLFGDGAGAAVLEGCEQGGILNTYLGTDGITGMNYINTGNFEMENLFIEGKDEKQHIYMDGREVFKFAVSILPYSIEKILGESKLTLEDIKYIVPHQANLRIVEGAAKRLKLSMDKFYLNIGKHGNTSAASIALALDEMNRKHLLNKGDKILLAGFGGGLTWGAALIQWEI